MNWKFRSCCEKMNLAKSAFSTENRREISLDLVPQIEKNSQICRDFSKKNSPPVEILQRACELRRKGLRNWWICEGWGCDIERIERIRGMEEKRMSLRPREWIWDSKSESEWVRFRVWERVLEWSHYIYSGVRQLGNRANGQSGITNTH